MNGVDKEALEKARTAYAVAYDERRKADAAAVNGQAKGVLFEESASDYALHCAIRAYRDALTPSDPTSRELVKVKPLEWKETLRDHTGYELTAITEIGRYYVIVVDEAVQWHSSYLAAPIASFSTPEAKAAAQADYTKRIMSAIDTDALAATSLLLDEVKGALEAEAAADAASEAADEILERAIAEDWVNDPTGSMHVHSARNRADTLRAEAKAKRIVALSRLTPGASNEG